MKSYRVTAYGAALEIQEQATPTPKGSEVLLRTTACGVCHSDVHLWEGYFDLGGGRRLELGHGSAEVPFTPGHEVAGQVVAVGPDATGVALGQHRVAYPWIGCGACGPCRRGEENLCTRPRNLGVHVDGGFADYVMVPHPRYLYDLTNLHDSLACTYACSGLTAFGAVKKASFLAEGETLMIIGAGGVGLMGVSFAQAVLGLKPVVIDIDEGRRQAALDAGAAAAHDPNDKDAAKAIFKQSGGGVAAAIDFVGAEQTVQYGLRALRNGGRLIVVGLFGGELRTPIPNIPLRGVSIVGSYVGTPAEMAEMVNLLHAGTVAPIPIQTRDLGRASETLTDLKEGRVVGRAVLVP
ncbi:MAG: alcohol dehydrogenase catalytic domain-containing protein [Hyphomicrobiales bacterium]|nr:alcohol dehydrogenase catalytic domain-containing protein [Hyphomicrobiales bacterium]